MGKSRKIEFGKSGHSLGINHPMMKPWHWHWSDQVDSGQVSTFEVCCDPTWSISTKSDPKRRYWFSMKCGIVVSALPRRRSWTSHPEPHELKADELYLRWPIHLRLQPWLERWRHLGRFCVMGKFTPELPCGLKFDINLGDVPLQWLLASATNIPNCRPDSETYYAECVVDA